MIHIERNHKIALLITVASLFTSPMVMADAVTDWNRAAGNIVVNAGMGRLPADRALAITSTAVYEAVNAITKRYPASSLRLEVKAATSNQRLSIPAFARP